VNGRLTRSAEDPKAQADGTATTGAEKQEEVRRTGLMKDVGVQTDDLQMGKEPAS